MEKDTKQRQRMRRTRKRERSGREREIGIGEEEEEKIGGRPLHSRLVVLLNEAPNTTSAASVRKPSYLPH